VCSVGAGIRGSFVVARNTLDLYSFGGWGGPKLRARGQGVIDGHGSFYCSRFPRIDDRDFEANNVLHVARHERQIMLKGGSGNEAVDVGQGCSLV
jgi:hypothetical protein